jgi:hypothetical protein
MIPLATQEDLQAKVPYFLSFINLKQIPAILEPNHEGKWRWIDTFTLVFEPNVRFSMATSFTVKVLEMLFLTESTLIPSGTKSSNGCLLQEEAVFNFSTPGPSVMSNYLLCLIYAE